MSGSHRVVAACLAVVLAGCAQEAPVPAADAAAATPVEATGATAVAVSADARVDVDARADEGDAPAASGFDITALPVSTAELGEFPFFSIPAGYRAMPNNTRTLEFGEFVFWNGDDLTHVEGRVYATGIRLDREMRGQKEFSDLEVVRNLQAVVTSAGGVEIETGALPDDVRRERGSLMRGDYPPESTCSNSTTQQLYVLRREDGDVWVRTCRGRTHAGLVVVQAQPLQVTSALLPASALQKALADDGRVVLQVHFATDRAEILPDSLPQVAQVVELLQADPALALSVEGHTDYTGNYDHNQALSQRRADAVVAKITEAGIAASRLEAVGLGASRPQGDDETDAGRAANRRVELVRRP
ncbi:MAG: OmpA family protein [Luteimonas sp.]